MEAEHAARRQALLDGIGLEEAGGRPLRWSDAFETGLDGIRLQLSWKPGEPTPLEPFQAVFRHAQVGHFEHLGYFATAREARR